MLVVEDSVAGEFGEVNSGEAMVGDVGVSGGVGGLLMKANGEGSSLKSKALSMRGD